MKFFGFELTKIKNPQLFMDLPLGESLGELLVQCNNSMMGVINEKAKAYNRETLEYYFGEVFNLGVNQGYKIKEEETLKEKI